MLKSRSRIACGFIVATLALAPFAQVVIAQQGSILAQCRAQTSDLDTVHACMDTYLDNSDESMSLISNFLAESLSGASLAGFNRSQQAFIEYRRQNCLWYLDFSSPRSEAEQIAKDCLAQMSAQRITELQTLLSANGEGSQTLRGYYVFGAQENSFQLCGSDTRYWIEGNANSVGLIQQNYQAIASDEQQLLYAIVVGALDTQSQAPEEHQGVLQLEDVIEIRLPTESDCSAPADVQNLASTTADGETLDQTREIIDDALVEQDEPVQQLTAYFGDWLVDCIEINDLKSCSLHIDLNSSDSTQPSAEDETLPQLTLNFNSEVDVLLEIDFPGREIDSPTLIRWEIDAESLGDIVESEIRVTELGTRQLFEESAYLNEQLMPQMVDGEELGISVLESVDDESGKRFKGSLVGLTNALQFADDFVDESA